MSGSSIAGDNRRSYNAAASSYSHVIGASVAHRLIVVPAMHAHLGDVHGKAVLCLGCGPGQELELLAELGARELVGVDISDELLRECERRGTGATLVCADLEEYEPAMGSHDVVYASMALQYVTDLDGVLERIHASLRPGGRLVFAVPHSVYYGAEWEELPDGERLTLGWEVRRGELFLRGDYLTERLQTEHLQGTLKVRIWIRSVSRVLQAVLDAGFELLSVDEPLPDRPAKDPDRADSILVARRQAIPLILVGSARRR